MRAFLGIWSRSFLLQALKEKQPHHRTYPAHLSVFSNAGSSGSLLCIASLLRGLRTLLKLCLNVFLASLSLFPYANALLARIALMYIPAFYLTVLHTLEVRLIGL